MNLLLSVLMLMLFCGSSFAQNNIFPSTGNVGIGTVTPQYPLDIRKASENNVGEYFAQFTVSDAPGQSLVIRNATSGNGNFIPWITASRNVSDNYVMGIVASIPEASIDQGDKPMLRFDARVATGALTVRPLFSWESYTSNYMTMSANGNLGIGTTTPSEKLAVNGTIRAKEIKVEATPWPDYVFDETYQLPSLTETEMFIKANKHLPDMPSAEDVEVNGVPLGEMNRLLLQKVEELTLHLIEKDKEISELKKQKTDIDQLKEQVEKLSAAVLIK